MKPTRTRRVVPRGRSGPLLPLLVLGIVLGAFGGSLQAQELTGRVASNVDLRPIAGAEVWLDGTRYRTYSDSLGRFTLRGVPSGSYLLLARHPSYLTVQDTVLVRGAETEDVVIFLAPDPIVMDTLQVSAISEAERRWRASGYGNYVVVDRADLMTFRQRGAVTVGDLFWSHYKLSAWIRHDISGIGGFITDLCLEYPRIRRTPPPLSRRNTMFSAGCRAPAVILDGDPMVDMGFVQRLSTAEIQSVEMIPPQDAFFRYGRVAENGALVITTRRAAAEAVARQEPLTPLQVRHRSYLMAGAVGGALGGIAYGFASGAFKSQGVSFGSDVLPALGIIASGLGVSELAFRKFGSRRE